MKAEGLTNSKFASVLGIQRSNITHILDGRNKPSLSFIEKLIVKFPRVNIEWLITGTGEMYKQNETSGQKSGKYPTLFPETMTTQMSSNQTVLQNVEQEINDVAEITNIPIKQKPIPESKLESQTEKIQEKTTNVQNPKQLTLSESGSKEKIQEEEIECVLIFNSDKTFKYYKPR
jgi:transcriptional regulator with XRE-family HTH domain